MNVLVIYGSLREKSINRGLAREFAALAPVDMKCELIGVGEFPLFNADLEASPLPEFITQYKKKIASADGILIVTPEYNRSMPGSLKNMIDWTSRGELPWAGKKVGVIGASDGPRGASFAQYDVKRIMTYFNAHVMGQPEFYLANSNTTMDAEGTIVDEKSKQVLAKYVAAFHTYLE